MAVASGPNDTRKLGYERVIFATTLTTRENAPPELRVGGFPLRLIASTTSDCDAIS